MNFGTTSTGCDFGLMGMDCKGVITTSGECKGVITTGGDCFGIIVSGGDYA